MLCDEWPRIKECFEPGREIIVACSVEDVVAALRRYDRPMRRRIGTVSFTAAMLAP
jgi:spore maturation protein CgeB